jgi:hypothetical protein
MEERLMSSGLIKAFGTAALVVAIFTAGAVFAGSQTGNTLAGTLDDDVPLRGETLERAIAAALAYTNGGRVTDSESGDDGATYSVEVLLPSGEHVEVNLDSDFRVIGSEIDDDGPGDDDD